MPTLVLSDKIYNPALTKNLNHLTTIYSKHLQGFTKGFEHTKITIKKLRSFDQRFEISISGPEEKFISNLLKKEIGSILQFDELKEGIILKGTMVDVGKVGFGIYVDCAIFNPQTDVLIELHSLRKQLCNGKKLSLKTIIRTFDFADHFPIHVSIDKINTKKKEIHGSLGKPTLRLFQTIIQQQVEAIIACGTTKSQFKKSLVHHGHLKDIKFLKKLSFLEHVLLLKKGTNAAGIIKQIGPELRGCKFMVLKPQKIATLLQE
ncbi:MAG: DUF2110 family protein [Promethearchaeota archaeon]